MSKFKIRHVTRYLYEDQVRDSANQIMLYPLEDEFQDTLQQSVTVTGNPVVNIHHDYYGNKVGTFTNARPHDHLIIDSQLVVITRNRTVPEDTEPAESQWRDLQSLRHHLRFIDFLKQERFIRSRTLER